ncbi:GNAT family N-acetyltransferase [Actinopolymorpha sp. B17G11]|uniref:GNAT family N-acetyltransferase n=1 Tax=Actinopolymorpha sp. B17G11 TaxID=3160861 RepID=UPI0032E3BE7F
MSALAEAEGWPTFSDPDRVLRLSAAPGVFSRVAVREGRVVGAAHLLSDGHHAYLTFLAVAIDHRRGGVGRRLIGELFRASGAERIDLLSTPEANAFYQSLPNSALAGFRLHPGQSGSFDP